MLNFSSSSKPGSAEVKPVAARQASAPAVTLRVIIALMLREAKTRFGKTRFGFMWAILEPLAYVTIFIVIRDQLRATIPFGENMILFLLTGLLPFRMFRAISSRGLSAISSNQALLGYPPVKPLDTVAARIVLETLTMLLVMAIFFTFLSVVSETKIIYHYDRFGAALCAITILAAGVGTFNAVVSVLVPTWTRIWNLMGLPMLLLSGVFYVPRSLPPAAQEIMAYNPILHCTEWLRYATYLTYDPLLSPRYIFGFATVALLIGLALERWFRFRMTN